LYTALRDAGSAAQPAPGVIDWSNPYAARFREAMDDDFNTPEAVAVLFELASEVNRTRTARDAALLRALGGVLGLLQRDPVTFLQAGSGGELTPAAIEALIAQRTAARKAKNFAEGDRIRQLLESKGVLLEDTASGTIWRRK
jgi:cysteinyl-tRNA synthetase